MPASIRRSCSSFSVCSRVSEAGRSSAGARQPGSRRGPRGPEGGVLRPVDGIDVAHMGHGLAGEVEGTAIGCKQDF